MRNIVKEIIKKNINFLNQNNHKLIFDLFEPSPNPLENNGDIPVKITGKVNVGKYKNTNNPTDFDAIGEITFTNTKCNQNISLSIKSCLNSVPTCLISSSNRSAEYKCHYDTWRNYNEKEKRWSA